MSSDLVPLNTKRKASASRMKEASKEAGGGVVSSHGGEGLREQEGWLDVTERTQSRRVSRVGLDVYLELVDHLVHLKVLGRVLSARGASPGLYLPSVRAVDHRVEVHDMLSILKVERLRAVVLFLHEGEGGPERRAVRNQQQRQSDPEAKAALASSRGVPHGDPI